MQDEGTDETTTDEGTEGETTEAKEPPKANPDALAGYNKGLNTKLKLSQKTQKGPSSKTCTQINLTTSSPSTSSSDCPD